MGKIAPLIREFQNYDKKAVAAIEENCFEDAWTEVMLLQQIRQEGSVWWQWRMIVLWATSAAE